MSEVDQIDNVMTLEDLFLSAEFGKTVVEESAPALEPLFWETSPGAPLLPLAAFPSTTGTHGTTTHMRRNRAFATASGVAAVLLVAVGLFSTTGKPKTQGTDAIQPTTTTTTPVIGGGGLPIAPPTTPSKQTTGGDGIGPAAINLAALTTGGGSGPKTGPIGPSPVGPIVTTPTTVKPSTPSATAPSGTILSPVVSVLGQVVQGTGNTVAGLGGTLTTALPPLTPVTSIVSGLGGTLSLLGNNLITSAA
jgi:hypothetical protein